MTVHNPDNYIGKEPPFYFDGYLRNNLDLIKKYVTKQNGDAVIIITGEVGSGKSVMAQQVARFFDYGFTYNKICFNPTQFKKLVDNAPKFSSIVYDEAHNGFSTRNIMKRENRELIAVLEECRYKNLFIILCTPTFYRMAEEIALTRSWALIETYMYWHSETRVMMRGNFSYYNRGKKWRVFMDAKKYGGGINRKHRNFYGQFGKYTGLDPRVYESLKLAGLHELHLSKEEKHDVGDGEGEEVAVSSSTPVRIEGSETQQLDSK